jgi:hypothetical protein
MQRPTAVTVFGILNILFAVLGVISIFASMAMLRFVDASQQKNPVIEALHNNAIYAAWFKLMIPLGMVSSVVLLAAGVGLLLLKNWARITSIIYAIYSIIVCLAGVAMNFVFLLMPLLNQSNHGTVEVAAEIGAAIGTVIGGVFGLVYPILVLVFMTRPKIVAAFQPAAFPPAITPQSRFCSEFVRPNMDMKTPPARCRGRWHSASRRTTHRSRGRIHTDAGAGAGHRALCACG